MYLPSTLQFYQSSNFWIKLFNIFMLSIVHKVSTLRCLCLFPKQSLLYGVLTDNKGSLWEHRE